MPAPPAVACFVGYVVGQRSRSAAVATCSLLGHGATMSLSVRLRLVTEDSVDAFRLSDIDRKCVLVFFTALL